MSPEEVLFLSDNVKEVDAALEAGMKAVLVDRPENAEVSYDDRIRLTVLDSLDEIELAEIRIVDGESTSLSPEAIAGSNTEDDNGR